MVEMVVGFCRIPYKRSASMEPFDLQRRFLNLTALYRLAILYLLFYNQTKLYMY